jgi:hypothetical protein
MSKKIEKLREIRDAIQSSGLTLIPRDKMQKEPDTEAEFKAYYKKIFAPENFDRFEYHEMSVPELKEKLAELKETRKRIGLPEKVDLDATIDEIWKRKQKI